MTTERKHTFNLAGFQRQGKFCCRSHNKQPRSFSSTTRRQNNSKTEQVQVLLVLGAIYLKRGDLAGAQQCLTGSVALDGNNAESRNNLGYVLLSQGSTKEAVAQLEATIRIQPDHVEAHDNLGSAFIQLGQYSQASSSLCRSVELDPGNADRHDLLATAYMLENNHASAVTHLKNALALTPDLIFALNNLAWIRATNPDAERSDAQQAVRLAERAVKRTHRENPHMLDTLATVYAEAGNFQQAVTTTEKALALIEAQSPDADATELHERLRLYRMQMPYRDHGRPGH